MRGMDQLLTKTLSSPGILVKKKWCEYEKGGSLHTVITTPGKMYTPVIDSPAVSKKLSQAK